MNISVNIKGNEIYLFSVVVVTIITGRVVYHFTHDWPKAILAIIVCAVIAQVIKVVFLKGKLKD